MKTIAFCAIVIAGSTFTMAVEDVYGWSKVRPHAQGVWDYANGLGADLMGIDARAEAAREAPGADSSGSDPMADVSK